ncbi:MAG TPA: metal-dependent transcriptional regulator [Candidatus Nanoarchaeia archaeon]|nr:metal-dependent transcriptional regulator [Candidatus Nanoarchaeia archaeon]
MVSVAKEDYVRAVYLLQTKGEPYLSDLAEYLNITKPSASEMSKKLTKQGYLLHQPYGELKLTAKGIKLAEKLTYKHRIIEVFLSQILNLQDNKIHNEAHKLEHAFSDESIERIRKLIKNPQTCPHGQPIHSPRS